MTLLRASTTVGILATISRTLGYVRDILIAAVLGVGPVADAFFIAFRLPNLFRRLFATGPFGSVFVPMLVGRMGQGGRAAGVAFAGEMLTAVAVLSILLTSALQLAMPWLMHVFAPGFASDPQQFDFAVGLARIMLVYILFVLLVLHLGGVLNALGRFAATAAMPVLLNLFLIASLLVLAPQLEMPAHALAWGLATAGAAQFACLWAACRRARFPLRLPRPRLTPGVRRFLTAAAPGAVGAGVIQVNLLADAAVASLLESGAVSYLYYAERVAQVPFGIVGLAVGTALVPLLSRQVGAGDRDGAAASMNRALEFVLLLVLPGAAALLLIAEPVVAALFERGNFTAEATAATAAALVAYATGLPAVVLMQILGIGFFSRGDTTTPMRTAFACIAANLALNLLLMGPLGHVGVALATAVACWLNAALLFFILVRRGHYAVDSRLRDRVPRVIGACLGMAGVLGATRLALGGVLGSGEWERIATLTVLVGVGLASFAGLAFLFGAARMRDLSAFGR